ncbi:MAG: hypothetical protein GY749_05580 [Desulfobacteraceae bacterium]|nr:hypothetical protein [Desulfobacteraceae bacterium]
MCKDDKTIAREFVEKNGFNYCLKVIKQGEDILNLKKFPWKKNINACNRSLGNPEKTRAWLQIVIEEMKSAIEEKRKLSRLWSSGKAEVRDQTSKQKAKQKGRKAM